MKKIQFQLDVLGEEAADERADRERERRDAGPDPDRGARAARGGKVAAMIESVAGFISAAPTPCTTRARDQQLAAAREPARERGQR